MKKTYSEPLVIMTQASTDSFEYFWLFFKSKIKNILNGHFSKTAAPGHAGVIRSLLEGLKSSQSLHIFNPKHENDITGKVVVLSGHDALKQAIRLKESGQVKKLFAGPNLVVSPKDAKALFSSNAVDRFVVNSQWVHDFYIEELTSLKNRLFIWPSGVDTSFWSPCNVTKKNSVLIYVKNIDLTIINEYTDALKKRNLSYKIINYGSYQPSEYFELLAQSQTLLYFSHSESQGLALLEAWSMDVPTYVWNNGKFTFGGKEVPSSPAPYLSDACGAFFKDCDAFLNQYDKRNHFQAREWVLANSSDRISTEHLVSEID